MNSALLNQFHVTEAATAALTGVAGFQRLSELTVADIESLLQAGSISRGDAHRLTRVLLDGPPLLDCDSLTQVTPRDLRNKQSANDAAAKSTNIELLAGSVLRCPTNLSDLTSLDIAAVVLQATKSERLESAPLSLRGMLTDFSATSAEDSISGFADRQPALKLWNVSLKPHVLRTAGAQSTHVGTGYRQDLGWMNDHVVPLRSTSSLVRALWPESVRTRRTAKFSDAKKAVYTATVFVGHGEVHLAPVTSLSDDFVAALKEAVKDSPLHVDRVIDLRLRQLEQNENGSSTSKPGMISLDEILGIPSKDPSMSPAAFIAALQATAQQIGNVVKRFGHYVPSAVEIGIRADLTVATEPEAQPSDVLGALKDCVTVSLGGGGSDVALRLLGRDVRPSSGPTGMAEAFVRAPVSVVGSAIHMSSTNLGALLCQPVEFRDLAVTRVTAVRTFLDALDSELDLQRRIAAVLLALAHSLQHRSQDWAQSVANLRSLWPLPSGHILLNCYGDEYPYKILHGTSGEPIWRDREWKVEFANGIIVTAANGSVLLELPLQAGFAVLGAGVKRVEEAQPLERRSFRGIASVNINVRATVEVSEDNGASVLALFQMRHDRVWTRNATPISLTLIHNEAEVALKRLRGPWEMGDSIFLFAAANFEATKQFMIRLRKEKLLSYLVDPVAPTLRIDQTADWLALDRASTQSIPYYYSVGFASCIHGFSAETEQEDVLLWMPIQKDTVGLVHFSNSNPPKIVRQIKVEDSSCAVIASTIDGEHLLVGDGESKVRTIRTEPNGTAGVIEALSRCVN